MRSRTFIAVLLATFLLCGCAHVQLRRNATQQARTLTDIYEQQVMDNLAMFVHDPNSLPSFAYPNLGGADVTDMGNIGSDMTLKRVIGFDSDVLKLGASRSMKESWTMVPVYDVRRLELMRCAYQQALECTGLCTREDSCPICDKLQRAFYVGDPNGKYDTDPTQDNLGYWSIRTGRTTPACLCTNQWLCHGDKKAVPKKCDCLKVGHYCGTYVWLAPGGQNELSKLTMVVLDYAFSSQATPPPKQTKEVTWYFDKNGVPIERAGAAQEMKAVVAFDAKVRLNQEGSILPMATPDATSEQDIRNQELDRVFENVRPSEPRLPPIQPQPTGFFPLQFELYRQTLTQPY